MKPAPTLRLKNSAETRRHLRAAVGLATVVVNDGHLNACYETIVQLRDALNDLLGSIDRDASPEQESEEHE